MAVGRSVDDTLPVWRPRRNPGCLPAPSCPDQPLTLFLERASRYHCDHLQPALLLCRTPSGHAVRVLNEGRVGVGRRRRRARLTLRELRLAERVKADVGETVKKTCQPHYRAAIY